MCGLLVEELHRGNPVNRGIITEVLDRGIFADPHICAMPVEVMALPYIARASRTDNPSCGTKNDFRVIPCVFAGTPRHLHNAWAVTDQDGCRRYVAPEDPETELTEADVLALIRTKYVGDWEFSVERLP